MEDLTSTYLLTVREEEKGFHSHDLINKLCYNKLTWDRKPSNFKFYQANESECQGGIDRCDQCGEMVKF